MWEFICQQNIYTQTFKTASRPGGLEGIVALLDSYDASQLLRFCNMVKIIWIVKIKQMKAGLIRKYVQIYKSPNHIQTDI